MIHSPSQVSMKMLGVVVGVACLSASVGGAFAQTLTGLNERMAQSLNITNHELAATIDSFRRRLHGDHLALFDKSQAAWEAYRRADCKFDSTSESGGNVQPILLSACFETLAKERLVYVENLGKLDHLTIGSSDGVSPPVKEGVNR
jgi:uncharacterized protein YecT (DUF1311 family)